MKVVKFFSAVLAAALMLFGNCEAASVSILDYPTVAVINFQDKAIRSSDWRYEDFDSVLDYATVELEGTGRFQTIERDQLKALLDEQSLQMTGLMDPATCVQIGKLTGAQYLLLGAVTGLTTRHTEGNVLGGGTESYTVNATISMRLVDVETGRVALAAIGHGKDTNRMHKAPLGLIHIGTAQVDKEQVVVALQEAVYDAIYGERGFLNRMDGKVGAKRRK